MTNGYPNCPKTLRHGVTGLVGLVLLMVPIAGYGQESDYPQSDGSEYGEGYEEDMDSESDYGEDYYSGSGAPRPSARPRGGGGSGDPMMQSYETAMFSILKSVDLEALLAPTAAVPEVDAGPALATEAEQAYQNGNYPLALELYFGHMATEYEQASVNLQTVAYSKLLRRPVWQTRFGVSFAVRGDLDAEPQPIKEGKKSAAGGHSGGGGPTSGYPAGYGEDSSEDDESYEEASQVNTMPEYDYEGMSQPSASGRKKSEPQAVMLSAEAAEELNKYMGLVTTIFAEEFESRYRQGDYGPALITVMPPQPVDRRANRDPNAEVAPPPIIKPMGQEVIDALADSVDARPLWRPGIVYYGEGESADILREAKRERLDVLLHFDIYLKAGRQDYVQNVSRCRVLHVGSGKSLGTSKGIDNFEAMRLVKTGRGNERDYVTEQLANLFLIMDRYVKTSEMPKLTPDIAKKRIGSLLSGPDARTLRTLAEIRLYQVQGLITEEDAEIAFDIIDGGDGLMMMHGPTNERLTLTRKWAIKAVPAATN